ncbi:MAG: phosphate ABC transporter permease subunit PstC, partial [Brachybacterium tyrofermentans]
MSTTDAPPETPGAPALSMASSRRRLGDSVFSSLSIGSGILIFVTLALVAIFLTTESMPAVMESREAIGDASAFSLLETTLPLIFGTI